jgi:catechol 2,3-dioxygenase-like lactoylglutathione lyase family enzyme
VRAVHHVSYTVSDLDRALEFYGRGLGFALLGQRLVEGETPARVTGIPGARLRIAHLRGHGIGLELIEYLAPAGAGPAPRTCDVGSSHLCFVVGDLERERERLAKLGARFLSDPATVDAGPNAGNRYVYFLDPDGIPMELTEPSKRPESR